MARTKLPSANSQGDRSSQLAAQDYLRWLFYPDRWIEQYFCIPQPLDPRTGEPLPPGPVRLADYQRVVVQRLLTREGARLPYQTIVWSSPKKTLKTTIAAAIAAWMACCYPDSEILLLANDGAQAHDRAFKAISYSFGLVQPLSPIRILSDRIELPNGSVIQPLPCDAEGTAGANPRLTVITEAWAYTTPQKRRLWAETTPPPGLIDAMRLVESYAGYSGDGSVLEELWDLAQQGQLDEVAQQYGLELWVNRDARLAYFYDHGRPAIMRLPWQTESYYAAQAATLPPGEYERIHLNQWVSKQPNSLEEAWFEQCVTEESPPNRSDLNLVVGVDAGVVRATFAMVAVAVADGRVWVLDAHVWDPHQRSLDYDQISQFISQFCERNHVVEIAYDPYQLHQMMTSLLRSYVSYTRPFQQIGRGQADSDLIGLFRSKRIRVPRDVADRLRPHYRSTAYDNKRKRFVTCGKGSNDLMVALSMAVNRALYYATEW